MRKLKVMFSLIMTVSLISITPVCIKADSIKVTDETVKTRYQDVEIRGTKPIIGGMSNTGFQTQLNERIDTQYNSFLKKTSVNTKKITISYKTVDSGNYFSILFYCLVNDAVVAQNYVSTTVIDKTNETVLAINDVIGPNGVKLINKSFASNIAANPNKYNTTFTGIDDNHNFYLDGETIYIPFDAFEIYAGSVEIVDVTFQIGEIKNLVLEKGDYKTKDVYGIKMVPLRLIAEEFGYTLTWNPANSSVDILLNKSIVTSVKIGLNSYTPLSSNTKRELESEPLLYDSRTYLPISFFDEILSISYFISPNGQITFSVYNK